MRLFSKTPHRLQSKPPKPTLRPQQKAPPNRPPPPPPPKPAASPRNTLSIPDSLLRTFYQSDSIHLLLYKAPNHTSFYLNSYIFGSLLLGGAIFQGLNFGDPPESVKAEGQRPKRWARVVNGTVAIMFAVFATAFFLAPTKLIKSVTLTKTAVTQANSAGKRGLGVVFEMKHPLPVWKFLPFMKKTEGGEVRAEVGSVFIDRKVRARENLSFYSVPANLAEAWTAHYFTASPPQRKSILSLLQGFNSSLVNAWPALRRDVGRMFMREGFAYVRIPDHGNWKMDLNGCEILEEGQVLEKVVQVDAAQVDRSWWTAFRERVGATELSPKDDKALLAASRKGLRATTATASQQGKQAAWRRTERK
jgi:hypothetical protein